jgi:2-dehydro-3-deoxygluconokinase
MRILCVGRSLLDAVAKPVKSFPPRFSAQVVENISLRLGGGGTITANVLARLGHDITLLSYSGVGPAADFLKALLENGGIDSSSVIRDGRQRTLVNIIGVDAAGNARYLMSPDDEVPYSRADLDSVIADTRFDAIHISTFNQFLEEDGEPLKSWLQLVRERNPNVIVVADTSKLAHCSSRAISIADLIDYFVGNQVELRRIAEHIALENSSLADPPRDCTKITEQIMSLGVRKAVVVKLGSSGAAYRSPRDEVQHSPAFVVDSVRDENGAGDVFCAAMLHSLLSTHSLEESVERANVLAAYHLRMGIDFGESSPIDFEKHVQEATLQRWPRSRLMTTDTKWWTFEQSTPGFGERFDFTRRLSEKTLGRWLDAITRAGNLSSNSRILDAGCGPGRFAIPLRDSLGCHITAVDCSEDVLRRARDKDCENLIEWLQADLTELDSTLGDRAGEFDCVWMSSVISQLGEDITTVLPQLHHQLRLGGTLLVRFTPRELIKRIDWFKYFSKAKQAAQERFPNLGATITHITHSGFHIDEVSLFDDQDCITVSEFRDRIMKGGFSWRHLYSSKEIEDCLAQVEKNCQSGEYYYHHPTYLIVAKSF